MSSFSSIQIEGTKAAPDRIYYNGTVINNTFKTDKQEDDPPLRFQDQRQIPLVPDASSYEVSVQNFSLNGCTKTLPLFIPQIDPQTPTDVTTTIYKISVGIYNASGSGTYKLVTKPIIWVPENRARYTEVPTTALPIQRETDYYYCYTYTHWISLVNNALRAAWTSAIVAGVGESTAGTQCPFMEFDELSGLFSINQDANTSIIPYGTALPQPYAVTSSATSPNGTYAAGEYSFVGWNTCLDNLFNNLPSIYYSTTQSWSGSVTLLPENVVDMGLTIDLVTGTAPTPLNDSPIGVSLKTKPNLSSFQLTNPFTDDVIANAFFVRLTEDFKSTGGVWSPIASFVLATTQIPVRNEASANPVTLGSANVGSGNASSGAFQKVLIETPINATTADIWKGWVLYEPLIPTFSSLDPSHEGVQDVDVNLFWRNRLTNSLIPLRVPNQATMSFRLLFKKKLVL